MMKIVLCGKPGRCCPTVERKGDDVIIRDDDGFSVKMTYEQFQILKKTEV